MKRSPLLKTATILAASSLMSLTVYAAESAAAKPATKKVAVTKKVKASKKTTALAAQDAIATSASAAEKPNMIDGVEVEVAPNAGKKSDSGTTAATTTAAPAAATSVSEAATPASSSALSKVIMNFNNTYYGAQLSEPFKMAQPDPNTGDNAAPARLESQLVLGYRVAPGHSLSAHAGFLTLAGATIEGVKSHNVTAKPMASYVRYANGAIIKKGAFLWNGDLRFYPSITDDLKCRGSGAPKCRPNAEGKYPDRRNIVRTGHNLSYDFSPKVNFTASNILRVRLRDKEFQTATRDFMFYESFLALNYNVSDKLQLTLGYDMTASSHYDTSIFKFFDQGTYLEPSLSYNITPKLVFNPWVDIYTGNKISMNTTQWGFNLLASIL